MSWTNELYRVYELAAGTDDGKDMLPISHSTANAQIEVTVSENGEFVRAVAVGKEKAVTIIPVTEDSAARSSGITPMPLADKLLYIAGDYSRFATGKRADNTEHFALYIKQLGDWCESEHSHYAIKAVYEYLSKKELIADLIGSGVLETDEQNNKLTDKKIGMIAQEDAFVRFIVSGHDGLCYTWLDKDLHNCFIKYYESMLDTKGLCYADGETANITYKHPAKIRNSGDKAKLISANDTSNFTYRGRFANKEEAVSVSYEFSQKMHNALKWLRDKQSKTYDSLTLITWNSALDYVPSMTSSVLDMFDETEEYSTIPMFSQLLGKLLMGGRAEIPPDSKVMIMGLDAATTGRLSIAFYSELAQSDFNKHLQKWHTDTRWLRYNSKLNKNMIDSCKLPQIAECLYGTEQNGFLVCDKKLIGDTILRLLPCVSEGRRLPRDMVNTLYNKASNPLAYEKEYNHRIIVENACALIRKAQIESDNKLYCKGEIKMAYDPNCPDRSYLFGCLLAIADKAERDTYDKDEKRITNARRYWNAFSARPCQTWKLIEERIEPYLEKESWVMTKYTKHINEIMAKMSPNDYADNSKLSPMYLIGFHHYNALLWNSSKDNNEEE